MGESINELKTLDGFNNKCHAIAAKSTKSTNSIILVYNKSDDEESFVFMQKENRMKYIVVAEVSPEVGTKLESDPALMRALIGKWQAQNPIGMYFSLDRRRITVILEAVNEDAFFEPLHATWVEIGSYPEVSPVAGAEEFGSLLERIGAAG